VPIVLAIIAILLAGVVALTVMTKRGTSTIGALSRETKSRDAATADAEVGSSLEAVETVAARERSDATREQAGTLVPRDAGTVAEWTPLDPEELSVSRRMFFNRAILMVGLVGVLPPFGLSLLAFLWPSGVGGFGSKVTTKLSEARKSWIDKKEPFYVPEARTYLQPYPEEALAAGASVYSDDASWTGMEAGVVALYQKCVHLGCRVPWCAAAQWFECPCHGSKYDRVGEKRDGPAPRGLDRWPVVISGDDITIDTSGTPINGPAIGVDTTKQAAEGPHCV
jgi:cytochrome b6-f complex iron-sulfur subunit